MSCIGNFKNHIYHLVWKSKLIWQGSSEVTDTFHTICHLDEISRQNMVTTHHLARGRICYMRERSREEGSCSLLEIKYNFYPEVGLYLFEGGRRADISSEIYIIAQIVTNIYFQLFRYVRGERDRIMFPLGVKYYLNILMPDFVSNII